MQLSTRDARESVGRAATLAEEPWLPAAWVASQLGFAICAAFVANSPHEVGVWRFIALQVRMRLLNTVACLGNLGTYRNVPKEHLPKWQGYQGKYTGWATFRVRLEKLQRSG